MNPKKRVIVDTNILISATLRPFSVPRALVTAVLTHHVVLFSRETYAEVSDRILRPKFDPYASRRERLHFLETLFSASEWVSVHTTVMDCRDPDDNTFLALALDGTADAIVTGDQDLLSLHPYGRVSILTPSSFLAIHAPSGM